MVIWKIRHEDNDGSGYLGYWPTKREALRACRECNIPVRDAEITKLTLKSKYDVITALGQALIIDNSFGGV